MSSIGTGYDLSSSTFSPDGRIFQVEYAQKAEEASGLCIGLRGKDGVVLAVEKIIPTELYEKSTNRRITNVDAHTGFASAGLYPDARSLALYAGDEAQNYYSQYRCRISPKRLSNQLAAYMHAYTLYSGVRPFGCSILMAGMDSLGGGPQLFMIEPSGLCYGYYGIAVGKNKQAAKTELEKLKLSELGLDDLVKAVAKIAVVVREEGKDKNVELEISWVGDKTNGKHELVPKEIIKAAEEEAKKALDDQDSDEEDMQT